MELRGLIPLEGEKGGDFLCKLGNLFCCFEKFSVGRMDSYVV